MLSQRWNPFRVGSASNEICSAYAQCAMKFIPRIHSMDLHVKTVQILPLAEHARKFVPHMLSVRWNSFLVCSVCDKIVSVYAQHAQAIIFENYSKSRIKMQISTLKNQNFEKPFRNPSNGTKVNFLRKKIFGYLSLVPRMLSHRGNARTSKFWRKSKEKKRNVFRKFTKGI